MSGLVQPDYAPPTGPQPSPGDRRRTRRLLAAAAIWAVLLAALTWHSVRTDPPTVREQRSISEAVPVVDRAVGELAGALGSDAVLALTPPEVDRGCRVTPLADGGILRRGISVVVPAGEERALLERVSDRLPTSWRSGVRVTSDGPRLRADAGEFVVVEGTAEEEGRITFTADTGCRRIGDDPAPLAVQGPTGPDADALRAALRAVDAPASTAVDATGVACPGGRPARTVRARPIPASPDLGAALGPLSGGTPVVATPEVYAYRAGPVSVIATRTDDQVHLTATIPCRA